jgi:pimeloyl-ACP methyl ester carboxylesterase
MWSSLSATKASRTANDPNHREVGEQWREEAAVSDLAPVSGAWRVGDPPGKRQFYTFPADRPFALDGGVTLHEVTVAYETWGTLDERASNAVLLCHAWTGDSHAAGEAGRGHPAPGWWDDVIGPGRAIDTDRWFVVCANVLGGCQGSTGPASPHPADGHPYGSRFPVVTIRDMVRAQARLATHLGVGAWHSVVGGSMGGMQVLEWALTFPQRVRSIVPIATCAQATAQQIAWGAIGRRAIRLDPRWRGGDYYDAPAGEGPSEGLAVARNISVEGVAKAGILRSLAGKVRLLQRSELPDDWDPTSDKRLCAWEATQQLIKRLEAHGEGSAGALLLQLKGISSHGELAANCRALAYRLYNHCEKAKQAEEARSYNGLVIAWPELERLASAAANAQSAPLQTSLI